jgi:hypothetical protein
LHLYRGFQPGATGSIPALRESFSGHDLELDDVLDDPADRRGEIGVWWGI